MTIELYRRNFETSSRKNICGDRIVSGNYMTMDGGCGVGGAIQKIGIASILPNGSNSITRNGTLKDFDLASVVLEILV
jgi:hypothetical protein